MHLDPASVGRNLKPWFEVSQATLRGVYLYPAGVGKSFCWRVWTVRMRDRTCDMKARMDLGESALVNRLILLEKSREQGTPRESSDPFDSVLPAT